MFEAMTSTVVVENEVDVSVSTISCPYRETRSTSTGEEKPGVVHVMLFVVPRDHVVELVGLVITMAIRCTSKGEGEKVSRFRNLD